MILKLAALTAALYLLFGLAIEAALYLGAYLAGAANITSTRAGWWFLFGLIWLAAFSIAWHVSPISLPGVRH